MPQILDKGAEPEWLMGGYGSTDGPVFSRLGYLLFAEAATSRIHKFNDEDGPKIFRQNSGGATGLTFDRQGRLLVCETAAKRVTRVEKNGSITVLAEKLEAPRDIVHAIDGSNYFTDRSAVYQIPRTAGPARVVAGKLARAIGVTLSSNQQTLYVAENEAGRVRAFEIQPNGGLARGRTAAEVKGPQGIKTDDAGNLYVAASDGVRVFSTDGKLVATIGVPEPSNLGWGGEYRTLYITAGASIFRIRTRMTGTRTF